MKRTTSICILTVILISVFFLASCSTTKTVKFSKRALPKRARIAVIIDAKNTLKNVVFVRFLSKGFNVKAINASDFYGLADIFDIKDLKKLSYFNSPENSLVSLEKTYSNIYKMHIYNYENNKAEILKEMKAKWGIDYLVILDLKDWQSVSWGRAINLQTNELIWLENYPTKFNDNIETVVDHFIKSMTGK